MDDEIMNVWSCYEYDGGNIMIGMLIWGIEGNSHVHLMTMSWSNVLTSCWVCDQRVLSSQKLWAMNMLYEGFNS